MEDTPKKLHDTTFLALQKLAADKQLKNASISFYALDLDSNNVIAGLS